MGKVRHGDRYLQVCCVVYLQGVFDLLEVAFEYNFQCYTFFNSNHNNRTAVSEEGAGVRAMRKRLRASKIINLLVFFLYL